MLVLTVNFFTQWNYLVDAVFYNLWKPRILHQHLACVSSRETLCDYSQGYVFEVLIGYIEIHRFWLDHFRY